MNNLFEKISAKFESELAEYQRETDYLNAALDLNFAYSYITENEVSILSEYAGEKIRLVYDYFEECKGRGARRQKLYHFVVAQLQILAMKKNALQSEYNKFLAECRPIAEQVRSNEELLQKTFQKNPLLSRFVENDMERDEEKEPTIN